MDIDLREFKALVEDSRAVFSAPDQSALIAGHAGYYFVTDILDGNLSAADARTLLNDPNQVRGRLEEAESVLKQMIQAPTAMLQTYIRMIDQNTVAILRRVEQHSGDLGAVHRTTQDLRNASADLISRVGNVERSTSVRTAVTIALAAGIATGLGTGLLSTWAYPHIFGPTPTVPDPSPPMRGRDGERAAAGAAPPEPGAVRVDLGPLPIKHYPEIVLQPPASLPPLVRNKDQSRPDAKRPVGGLGQSAPSKRQQPG